MESNKTDLARDFQQIIENRHAYAKNWKESKHGKVCGYLSNMVPEEYLYAANVLPVRILPEPTTAPTSSTTHIQANRCACCHGSLEEGLRGNYDYLDGLVYVQTCLAQSLVFSSWVMHLGTPWTYKMFGPWREIPSANSLYQSYLNDYKTAVEKWRGVSITEDGLSKALSVFKENRALLSQVYDLRKKDPPLIKGSEAQKMVLASMLMDKNEHNDMLRQVLQQAEKTQRPQEDPEKPVRVMIVGSGLSPLDLIEMLESLKAEVVIEDHCLGLRYFWDERQSTSGDERTDDAIMTYYHQGRAKCAYQEWMAEKTISRFKNLVTDYQVEGVIWLEQAFCGTWQWTIPEALAAFDTIGVPVLRLQRGRTLIKGRVKPQLETLLDQAKTNRKNAGGAR
jgi:benzoyl-CoA reductase subunit C